MTGNIITLEEWLSLPREADMLGELLALSLTSKTIEQDYKVIKETSSREDTATYFRKLLADSIDTLEYEIEEQTLNALAWMIYDGIIRKPARSKISYSSVKLFGPL